MSLDVRRSSSTAAHLRDLFAFVPERAGMAPDLDHAHAAIHGITAI
jgi:hypothetical protein